MGYEQIMPTRRQEKIARVIKEAVSDAIANHLNDPRIEGFVSVTRIEMGTDLRNVDVYLSIFGKDETAQNKTFTAISHAKSRIQSLVAGRVRSKFCPVLHLYRDEKFKKTLEIMKLINQAVNKPKKEEEKEEEKEELDT
ncbi:MAG: 30S ribosome-binding factor RbfA [Planctomycetes bacterium]|nr:30S ribosome-binding factor RbfA [Planctomycetota bacterium]